MKIKLRPFMVPNFAMEAIPPSQMTITARGFPLKEVDAETLATMCDEFRATVFKKAGKPDPRVTP